mmetsp:Transcript_208/g.192  ORF Transcript_208/g.192 Transcript_208/m.192 type:complete len:251 (-) Transcript_208:53-805(-)|eukprot:CAMPEP_0182428646 /NCGR_PEP_ID=MMETSP1167-20130531/23175_1 /TAXON_ID=2988 /ORGANISM="Mallomonas Sp, Strain CCMP3275" /LENGTH=250 /DNA_ID=CAMNT_0024611649 /DNA_START=28 /DNA_END=780 /DNA_ORIENTATION=-
MVLSSIISVIQETLNSFCSVVPPPASKSFVSRKVLLIHAHPVPESFSTHLSISVESGLRNAGHQVRVRRLYCYGKKEECYCGKSFQPVLSCEEKKSYLDNDLVNIRREIDDTINSNSKIPKDIQQATVDLRWCDSIVFVYPTWWYNFPAILKGYLDRVFLKGIGFELDDKGLHPGLMNVDKIGVVTTYGSPWYAVLYMGDNGRRFISRGLRECTSPTCHLAWYSMYDIDSSSIEDRQRFLTTIEKEFEKF